MLSAHVCWCWNCRIGYNPKRSRSDRQRIEDERSHWSRRARLLSVIPLRGVLPKKPLGPSGHPRALRMPCGSGPSHPHPLSSSGRADASTPMNEAMNRTGTTLIRKAGHPVRVGALPSKLPAGIPGRRLLAGRVLSVRRDRYVEGGYQGGAQWPGAFLASRLDPISTLRWGFGSLGIYRFFLDVDTRS